MFFTVVESEHDERRAFIDAEWWKYQSVEAIIAEVQCRLDNHSYLLRSSH